MLRSPPFVAPGAAGVDLSVLFRNQQTSKFRYRCPQLEACIRSISCAAIPSAYH
jgi:hypothetical protein